MVSRLKFIASQRVALGVYQSLRSDEKKLVIFCLQVEESENEWAVPHCFTIYSAQKTIVVAASTRLEMGKWMEDLNMAIEMAKKSTEKSDMLLDNSVCNRSNRSSDEVSLEQESEDDIHSSRSSLDRQSHHRANTTMHVCWYRNTSVSMADHSVAVESFLLAICWVRPNGPTQSPMFVGTGTRACPSLITCA